MPKRRLSPLPIPTKRPRDNSKISKTWWAKKREEKRQLAEQLTKLQGERETEHAKHREEIDRLENDRRTLEQEKAEITAALDDAEEAYAEKSLELEEAQLAKEAILESLADVEERNAAMVGDGEKKSDNDSCSAAIGTVILNALSVIMKHTQPITHFAYCC